MNNIKLALPVGIEDFEEIRTEGYFYIDKTDFIKEILNKKGKVNLFTRPRRFGKSLNMDMLRCFLEIGCNKELFNGLDILKEKELCKKHMGQYPVISISLKSAEGTTFESALINMSKIIQDEAIRFQFLLQNEKITEIDKIPLIPLFQNEISLENQQNSLKVLSRLLYKYYGKKVIIIIDEYDVPLNKAYENGYYDNMVSHIRGIFQALKSNRYLQFAVLTGCMRISKESIFTGLNNLKVLTIADVQFDEYFGFTNNEVKEILSYYNLTAYYDLVKEWYNGYRFGDLDIYCPWDVINYCDSLLIDSKSKPKAYWINSSGNNILRKFIDSANSAVRKDIEKLMNGDYIERELFHELTYQDIETGIKDDSLENNTMWSILYTTGYLTHKEIDDDKYKLIIPNKEILKVFETQIKLWFERKVKSDEPTLKKFCSSFKTGDVETIQRLLNRYLKSTISIRDTYTKKSKKENFYHGLLLGLLRSEEDWIINSNSESGDGYSDIIIEFEEEIGCIIEVKYAENRAFDKACEDALNQIENRDYKAKLIEADVKIIYAYGIACYKKQSSIVCKKLIID